MESWNIINIILNAFIIFSSLLTAVVSIAILSIIIIFHRKERSVPILLASYSYLALLISAIMATSMSISSLFGFIGIQLQDHGNTVWCRVRFYIILACYCALYDAYSLQTIFRFFRVVFHRRKVLHSFNLYCILVPLDIIFAVICVSPTLIWNQLAYLPSEFFCLLPFTNLIVFLYGTVRLYGSPLVIIFTGYWYLVRYVRRTSPLLRTVDGGRRVRQNARDLAVIKRLVITFILLLSVGLPYMVFLVMFIVTGNTVSIAYRVAWFSVAFSSVFLAFTLVKHTSPLQDTVKRLVGNIGFSQRRVAPQQTIETITRRN